MSSLFQRLLPQTDIRADRARAALVLTACGAFIVAILGMILFWVVTGNLEDIETVVVGVILVFILLGLADLARRGRSRLALWALVTLTAVFCLADTSYYGVATPSAAEFLIPILLAATGAGLQAGLIMALVGSTGIWLIAYLGTTGLVSWIPTAVDALTFYAPLLTILFFLVAVIVGIWGQEMRKS